MIQASRIVIIGLLALMQLIAPLVHAHTGGGQSTGFIHVPGLEFLANTGGDLAQPLDEPGSYDLIVGLTPGLKDNSENVAPAADPEPVLPVFWPLALPSPPALPTRLTVDIPPPLPQQFFSPSSPRAPPVS